MNRDWIHVAQDNSSRFRKYCNERSGFLEVGEFIDYLSDKYLLKKRCSI